MPFLGLAKCGTLGRLGLGRSPVWSGCLFSCVFDYVLVVKGW